MAQRNDWFDGPDRAVRFAHGVHRHHHHGRPPAFFGFVLLTLGVLFLLDNLNVIEARYILRTYWPTIVIAFGLARLFFGRGGERVFGAAVAVVGGILQGNRLLGWDIEIWDLLWPLAMMVFGIHILLQPGRFRRRVPAPPVPPVPPGAAPVIDTEAVEADEDAPPQPDVDTSARFQAAAVTATVQRKIVSQALQGGAASAVLGGLELDLRDCRMAGDSARITIRVVMGEVVLRIPRDWTVENHIAATLANVENHTDAPVDAGSKRLVLEGSAVLGNVEIRN